MDSYQMKAYAKINLGLDVIRKLESGYHEVRMIMQTIGIYDELQFQKGGEGLRFSTDSGEVPADADNLIVRAARLMMQEYHIPAGLHIHLKKTIPVAAGLAGGSADAAATLKGINRLFDLDASLEDLMRLGVRIGADVPYCVLGGTALAEGIGEKLTSLNPAPECFVMVAKPDVSVSTRDVYESFDAAGVTEHPDIDRMVDAIWEENFEDILDCMGNVLESVTVKRYPVIDRIKRRMRELGALNSMMSGSGPSVFGIFVNERIAREAFEQMKTERLAPQLFLTEFC